MYHKKNSNGLTSSLMASNNNMKDSSMWMSSLVASTSNGFHMLRSINLLFASSLMTGIVIGSGIFVSPVSFVQNCGSVAVSLILWVLSGVLVLLIVLMYLELGSMFPSTGAEYIFYKTIIGDFPAFLFAWIALIAYFPAYYGLLALTTTDYALFLLFPECPVPKSVSILISCCILILIVVLNCTYADRVAKVQTFFTGAKLSGLLLIIVIGIVKLAQGETETLASGFENTTANPTAYVNAIYAGVFTYGGWQYVFTLLEEMKDPAKVAKRASIISMTTVTCIYTFTNVAYFTVLTPEEMMSSSAVAMTFAQKTIGKYSAIVPILVACSTIGALNGSIMGGSRVYFAAARDNLFPAIFSAISPQYLTPWPALIITCFITVLYILTGSAVKLIEFVGFIAICSFILSMICVLVMRYREPNRHRPIKPPLCVPIFLLLLNVFLMLMGLYHDPIKYGFGVLLISSGIPVYIFVKVWKTKPKYLRDMHHNVTCTIEKILLVYPSDK